MTSTPSSDSSPLLEADGNEAKLHPVLNYADADVVLSSNENTLFRLHSITLKLTSGYFRSILSNSSSESQPTQRRLITDKPTTDGSGPGSPSRVDANVHTLPFPDAPLERVLLMISGLPTDPWASFNEAEAAANVMSYLDTPGPLSLLRASSHAPFFSNQPIRLLGLAIKLGWDDVVQQATELSLGLNLLSGDPGIEAQLLQLPGSTILGLMKLSQQRRSELYTSLRGRIFYCDVPYRLGDLDHTPWRHLTTRLALEFANYPNADRLLVEMADWEEARECWMVKCNKFHNPGPSGCFPQTKALEAIQRCLRELPTRLST